jgi:hypothetical protein
VTEAELREFMREMILRFERQTAAINHEVRVAREELRRHSEESDRHFAEQRRKTDEIIAEGRAQREALFRIVDRLGGEGAAPAT